MPSWEGNEGEPDTGQRSAKSVLSVTSVPHRCPTPHLGPGTEERWSWVQVELTQGASSCTTIASCLSLVRTQR